MLDSEKAKKETRKNHPKNGHMGEILAQLGEVVVAVGNMAKIQQEQNERLAELERNQDASGRAKLLATDMAYNPDDEHLSDMAVIIPRAVEPFALQKTLDAVLSDDVRKGKKSLSRVYIAEVKHLSRGLKGKGFELAAQHAREQEITRAEGMGSEAVDLGRGF